MSLAQISTPPQSLAEVVTNRNFETLEHQSVYGQRQSAHSGLTWGYYGGRWGGFSVSDGTLTLSNATNYVVVELATGAISTATTRSTMSSNQCPKPNSRPQHSTAKPRRSRGARANKKVSSTRPPSSGTMGSRFK